MADQPSFIPSAWAANNSTTETIPATTTESGKASWDQGFPVETSLPLSEGGIPPKYGDFNGVLNVLSQFCLFAQAGGQYAWSNTLDYSVGSIVLGTDGSIYRAAQVSGPSTTAVNPVGDTSGKWERIVSQSDINALEQEISDAMDAAEDAASNASAAQSAVTTLDANVVKLSGNQSIGGVKTFSDWIIAKGFYQNVASGNVVIGGGNGIGANAGAKITLYGASHDTNPGQFSLLAGNATTYKILNGKPDGTLTWGGKEFVYTSGNQDVAGAKTFTSSPLTEKSGTPIIVLERDNTTSYSDLRFSVNGAAATAFRLTGGNNFQIATKGSASAWYEGCSLFLNNNNTFQLYSGYGSSRYELLGSATGGLTWRGNTIQTTSDERLKTAFSSFPDDILDVWATISWEQFKYKSAATEKGENKCRWHAGLVAQHILNTFEKQGQDVLKYGILCHDIWDDEYTQGDDGKDVLVRKAGDQWTVRYTEALCMEAAYQRRRADRAEARITSLEQRIAEMEAVLASLLSPAGDETYAEPEQEAEQEGEE